MIDLCHDHGTSEQFHSQIKADLNIERPPGGNIATNELILHLGMLVYNTMRIIGQESLAAADVFDALPQPRHGEVRRRGVRTVMRDLIDMVGRLFRTAGQWFISSGRLDPFAHPWERIEPRLRMGPETG